MEGSSLCAPAVPPGRSRRPRENTERRLVRALRRPGRRPGGSVSAAAPAGPSGGPALTLRRDLLRRRGRRLQRPQRGHAEGGRQRLGRGGAEQAAVRVPRPEALPPGRRAPEHLVLALHRTRGDPHSLPAGRARAALLGLPLPSHWKAGGLGGGARPPPLSGPDFPSVKMNGAKVEDSQGPRGIQIPCLQVGWGPLWSDPAPSCS